MNLLKSKLTFSKPNFLLHTMSKLIANFLQIACPAADPAQQQLGFRKPCSGGQATASGREGGWEGRWERDDGATVAASTVRAAAAVPPRGQRRGCVGLRPTASDAVPLRFL